jgi:hypothetical protein
MTTTKPEPFHRRHIVFGERLIAAWLNEDRTGAHAIFDEVCDAGDLVAVLEYLIGAAAVERVARVGEDQAATITQQTIQELTFRRPHLTIIKSA